MPDLIIYLLIIFLFWSRAFNCFQRLQRQIPSTAGCEAQHGVAEDRRTGRRAIWGTELILRNVGIYKVTRSHAPDDHYLNTNRSENLKSRAKLKFARE
jgi:hypothetical protein